MPGSDSVRFAGVSEVDGLWVSLREAYLLAHSADRTAVLADLVLAADRAGAARLAVLGRRVLAEAHRVDGRWAEVRRLHGECLAEYDRGPGRFGRADVVELLRWSARQVEAMIDFPDLPLADLDDAVRGLARRCTAAGTSWHDVYAVRRALAAHLGDRPGAAEAHLRWLATAPAEADDRWVDVGTVLHHLGVGEADRAREAAARVLADPVTGDEATTLVRCLMLTPLVRGGETGLAALTYRRVRRGMAGETYSPEQVALVVEFCALTGNLDAGLDWAAAVPGFADRGRPFATMEIATSLALLGDTFVAAGRGDTLLDVGSGPEPLVVLAGRLRDLALAHAARFDRRNGNSVQDDRVRARLAARPAGFLPLDVTSRPPLRVLPPPGLSDAALLARAEWHDLRGEAAEARACLSLLPGGLGPHLDAWRGALLARFFPGEHTEPALWQAARAHRRHGDERRALLTECWLGLWIAHVGRGGEGIATTSAAVEELHRLGDDVDIAWGEYWYAHVLAAQGALADAGTAVDRGRRHATAAGEPLVLGTLLTLDAALRPAPDTAAAALDALVTAGAPERAIEALDQVARHAGYLDVVTSLLAGPPRDADRLVGRLRYLRACAAIDAGRPADAVDDLVEAVGQASVRGEDTAEQWYQLALAAHAAGRYEDAADAGVRATTMLDEDDGGWADQARLQLAESYRALGDRPAALGEYRRLADGDGTLAASAFVAGSALLEELGRPA